MSAYREPPTKTVRVDVALLKRVHRAFYKIGSVDIGWWDEIDALKQEVARACFADEDETAAAIAHARVWGPP